MNSFTPGVPGAVPGGGGVPQQPVQPAPVSVGAQPQLGYAINMDALKAQAEEIAAHGAFQQLESDFYSFQKGINYVRCLPPWSAEVAAKGQFTKFSVTHFNITESKLRSPCWEAAYPNLGFRCPICLVRNVLGRYMGDLVKETQGRGSHACNAVVYDSPDQGRTFTYKRLKPYVLKLPITVWGAFMQMFNAPYIGNITDLNTGWIIAVNKPESFKGKSTYSWQHIVQGPLGDENTTRQIMADTHNLDTFADLGIPTVEKLQKQFELAKTYLNWVCNTLGTTMDAVIHLFNGQFDAPVVPPVVSQVHGQQQAVPGLPGGPAPGQTQQGAPTQQPVAPSLPGPAPITPAAIPGAPLPGMPPPPVGGPAGAPPMPAAGPMGAPPAPAPQVPGMPGFAPMPTAPAGAPSVVAPNPFPQAAGPQVPAMGPSPISPPPGMAAVPQAPQAAAPQAPQAAPPAPIQVPGMQGGQGANPFPFPQAPAPQQEETPPTSEAGEAQGGGESGKVKCPGCGKEYKRLKAHLARSPECQKAAAQEPVPMEQVAPEAQPQAATAPAPAAPAAAPAGMAPPDWGQTGPFPQT